MPPPPFKQKTFFRQLAQRIEIEDNAISEGNRLLAQETALRGEIISAKFKLNRLSSASMLLGSVEYSSCPRCGTQLSTLPREAAACNLCGAPEHPQNNEERRSAGTEQPDLNARLVDIEQSIAARKKSLRKQESLLEVLRERKAYSDLELSRQMRDYDSAFLSQVRNLEREIASGRQELIGLRRDSRIPDALRTLEEEADAHLVRSQRIRREIKEERIKLADRDNLVDLLASYVFEALMASGFPALTSDDKLQINRRNWMAYILPHGDDSLAYTLSGAGSGGKKTLFNICYAVALHRLVEEMNLPLPMFLIIDSPMKNIGTEVNRDIFIAFYNYVYGLLSSSMRKTQLIIIDTELSVPPPSLNFTERLMIAGNAEHPPLIPYYSGH
jgi:DNA repair exonuclease SbcCD ATPase subunit